MLRAQYDACWRFVEQVSPVEEIAAPTLVVHGDADRIVPVANGRMLAARLPSPEYVELAGHGHNLTLEAPETLSLLVGSFLERE